MQNYRQNYANVFGKWRYWDSLQNSSSVESSALMPAPAQTVASRGEMLGKIYGSVFGRVSHLCGLMVLPIPFPVRCVKLVAVFCLVFAMCVSAVAPEQRRWWSVASLRLWHGQESWFLLDCKLCCCLHCWIRLGRWESIRRWVVEAKFNWLLW